MPLASSVKSRFGPSGLCEARVLKNTVKIVTDAGDVYEIAHENVSDKLPIVERGKTMADAYFTLDDMEQQLWVLRPWSGSYGVKFAYWSTDSEDKPRVSHKPGGPRKSRDGGYYIAPDREKITANLEIQGSSEPWAGYVLPYSLDYMFVKGEENIARLHGQYQSWVDRFESFLVLAGFDLLDDSVPYSPEAHVILDWLQGFLLKQDKMFQAIVEEGWIDKLSTLPTGWAG